MKINHTLKLAFLSLAALTITSATSAEDAFPSVRAGLWETTSVTAGQPSVTTKTCIDDATTKSLFEASKQMMGGMCSGMEFTKKGNEYHSNVNCEMGPTKLSVSSVVSGDFQKSYTSKTTTKMDPPLMGQSGSTSTQTAKYIGECPEGMNPGDTEVNGKTMNAQKMMDQVSPEMMKQMGEMMKNLPR